MNMPATGAPSENGTEQLADALSGQILEQMRREPKNYAEGQRLLADLKLSLVKDAADLFYGAKYESWRPSNDFFWNLAEDLPDFNADALYRKRATLPAIGGAVFLGWLLGGFLSTFLGFLGLGGEILRPLSIFCLIWLGEYLAENPRARNILLTCLGLGGLARFAASAVNGFIGFTTFGAWRAAIFGRAALPNIFKCAWLFFGSFFVFVFFARKITGLDFTAFQGCLRQQIGQRLKLVNFIFAELDERERELANMRREMENATGSGPCPRSNCSLATGVMSVLESLDAPMRDFLTERLAAAGYALDGQNSDSLIWNSAIHSPLYDTIGLIRDGDHFKILRRSYQSGGKLVKGHAQRAASPKTA